MTAVASNKGLMSMTSTREEIAVPLLDRFDDPQPPPPAPDVVGRVRRRGVALRRRRHLTSGTAAAVVALVAGAVGLQAADSGAQRVETAASPTSYCAALAAPMRPVNERDFDVAVWMLPSASSESVEALRVDLERDPRVRQPVEFVDQNQAFDEFNQLYPSSPEILVSVTPENLPFTFYVDLAEGVEPQAVADEYGELADVKRAVSEADIPPWRLVDAFLVSLAPGMRGAGAPAVDRLFDSDSLARLDEVVRLAPPTVAADVEALVQVIRDESDEGSEDPGAHPYMSRKVYNRVADDVAMRCSLQPTPRWLGFEDG